MFQMSQLKTKNCFVIIGYGTKVDLATQRQLNLDRVYENIIKPVFDSFTDPAFQCFRASDKNFSGLIDKEMYKWIYEAEFVVADISTLNPNAIYELGIRHALRPYSTIVIAEDGIKDLPFDINHVKIEKYKHLGDDIGVSESKRFTSVLKALVQQMLNQQANDSPVYAYIPELKPPYFGMTNESAREETQKPIIAKPLPAENIVLTDISLAELLSNAAKELNQRNFIVALNLFKKAEERDRSNNYIKQKIILCTYKTEIPDRETALNNALELFNQSFNIEETLDRAILEQGATINKKLAQIEYEKGAMASVQKAKERAYKAAIAFEKACVLSNSYFIESSYADSLLIVAALEDDLKVKYHLFLKSCLAWQHVYDFASKKINQHKNDKSKWRDKRVLLEKIVQATLVLKNGIEDDEVILIKEQLNNMETEYQKKGFSERIQKSVVYVRQVREALKGLDKNEMFL